MPSLQSSPLPIHPPCSSSLHHQSSYQAFFLEPYGEKKKLLNSRCRRGKPTRLVALAFSSRIQPKSIQYLQFFSFRRNGRLPIRPEVELLNEGSPLVRVAKREPFGENGSISTKQTDGSLGFVPGHGELPDTGETGIGNSVEEIVEPHTTNGDVPYLVEEDYRIPRRENPHLDEENCATPAKEHDMLVSFTKKKGNLPTSDLKLLDSRERSSRLHVGDLLERISSLPVEERVKVLDLFQYDDKHLTISDYNDILTALVKAGEFESAIDFFSELPSHGVSPDSQSFSIMVYCWCKKNQPDEAKRVLDEMLQNGFHPNVGAFTVLVNNFCKRGRLKKAFEVFEIMNRIRCEPTIRTYNYLIGGLCYVGRLEEASQLLKKIKESPKTPDIYTFTLVIDGFCKVGRTDEAIELLKEAQEMGLTPTIVTYNALLNGYCKEGRPLESLRLLKEMQRGDSLPDFISYSTVLQGLLRWGEISAALKTYKKMKEAGFQADLRVMSTLLRGLCRQPMVDGEPLKDVEELFEKVMETDFGPSPYTYCLMVQALAKGGKINRALALLHEMVKKGCSPRMMTYNIVLRILCEQGRADDAFDVLILMINTDKMPSRFSFRILLDEFDRQGRLLNAFGVYAAAVKRGVVPNWKPKEEKDDEKELSFSV